MTNEESLKRWRLILGGASAEGTGFALSGQELQMDKTLGRHPHVLSIECGAGDATRCAQAIELNAAIV